MPIYFAQTSGTLKSNASTLTPIPGLSVPIPEGVGESALIILNLPNPYAEGNNFPGATLGISVNGTVLPATATFTYGVQQPASYNRMPTTLVVSVPLAMKKQTIQGLWCGVRGSTVIIDSPSSLSAIVA